MAPRTLVLQLDDATQRDIFHRLCLDIVAAAGDASTESDAVKLFSFAHGDGAVSPTRRR